jgi:outer membrane protein assembly factor BamD
MFKKYFGWLLMAAFFISLNSCSKFSRIQKSTDVEAKYKAAVEYYDAGGFYQSLQLFEELVTLFRGTQKAEITYYYYCMCYYQTGEFVVAAYHFKNFVKTFPGSKRAEQASFNNAMCYYLDSPKYSLDQSSTYEAINEFQLFVNRFPTSEKVEECNTLIDELRFKLETKEYQTAKLYYLMGKYKASVAAFKNTLKLYPNSKYKEDCLYFIMMSSYKYAEKSIKTKQSERYNSTIEAHNVLLDTYPSTKYTRDAQKVLQDSKNRLKKLDLGEDWG